LGILWALGWAAPYLPEGASAAIQSLAFEPRLTRFAIGLFDFGDAAYFLAMTALGLILAKPLRD
jgi:hypothetical protein